MGHLIGTRDVVLQAYLRATKDRDQASPVPCAMWAAEWVRLCTGRDLAAFYEGRFTTLRGALRVLRHDGFEGVEDLAAAHLTKLGSWAQAQVGDVALLSGDAPAFGIVGGGVIHILRSGGGHDHVPLSRATWVFRP